jgi:hypothetical protein
MVWSGLLPTFVLMSVLVSAQVGTVTQDITAIPDFSLQKQCAQGCFVRKFDVCPMDMLGIGLDCATIGCGVNTPWLASNDCYCRLDAQQPAQELLDSCISSSCTVGNPSVYGREYLPAILRGEGVRDHRTCIKYCYDNWRSKVNSYVLRRKRVRSN